MRKENRQTRNVLLRSSPANNPESAGSRWHLGYKKALSKTSFGGILVIGGPTASGKTDLAVEVALRYSGEIINADSRQLYRELTIGTGQPSDVQKHGVPHHLYGFLEVRESFTAADYQEKAAQVIAEIHERGNLPIIVGGTGFYIKALLKGVWDVPARDPELRKRFREIEKRRGKQFLYRLLQRVDSPSAAAIASSDTYRVIRALEIYFQSGKKRSEFVNERPERWNALKFFLNMPREQLRERIRQRTEQMFASGWVEEVKSLLQKYSDFENTPAAASLGYRHIVRYLQEELTLEQCKEAIIKETSQYAKRQVTWFRNQDSFTGLARGAELYKIIGVLQLRGGSSEEGS